MLLLRSAGQRTPPLIALVLSFALLGKISRIYRTLS